MKINKLQINKKAWDKVAEQFFSHSALPIWGPFNIGKNTDLIGSIKGKTFLDIGFGSGHSIKYLIERGAKKVYGVDISNAQFQFASKLNKKHVEAGTTPFLLM
ncbi:MAG: class I SAM-dependent methyltransferase [Patescibacteria group bacterium]